MKTKSKIAVVLVGLIIGAIAFWFQPYSEINVLGLQSVIMSGGAFLASFLLTTLLVKRPGQIAPWVSLGVGIAVILRIIYDVTFWDPTSHNLFPFVIIVCGIVTVPPAFVGAYLSLLIRNLLYKIKN